MFTRTCNTLSPYLRLRKRVPVKDAEIKAFIAIILNMDLILKPTIKSYWSDSISLFRFLVVLDLSIFFHFLNG